MSGFSFTIPGQPRPQRRHRHSAGGGGHRDPVTAAYEQSVACAAYLAGMRKEAGPFRLSVKVWRKSATVYDVDNLLKSVLDGMVRGGALKDDSIKYVPAMAIEHVGTDKEDPRCVVTLELIE